MMLSLAASLSVDAVTAMLCFLCVAWLLRLAADKQKITYVRGTCIVLIICLAILAKNGAYIAFSGLIFVLPSSAFGSKKGQVLFFAVTSVLAVGLVLLWQRYMLFDSVYGRMAAESGTQRILERPWEYVNWIFETLTHEKGYLWDTFVGRLGWNDTLLPAWIRYSALVLFTLVSVFINFERVYPSPWQRTVLIGVALSNVLLIYYAFFSLNILGIQGRYFIPLGLCLLLPLTLKRFNIMERLSADGARSLHRGTLMAMIAYFVVVHCATYQTLLMRFWSN